MSPSDFIHPEDAAALKQLESIPGFPAFVKSILSLGLERLQYGINMASCVRLSEKQLPQIYRHLPPICQKLGINEPEFYLEMDPNPNAYTFGDSRIFITVTSGLLEMMDDEELDAVIAHECGHILCHHVLYHSIARYILAGIDSLGILGALTVPIQLAFLYWQRKSELSSDRAAAIATSPEVVARVMGRLSAGPQNITAELNMDEWAKQADEYDALWKSGTWNKALQIYAIASKEHPFAAVRVREVLNWGKTAEYRTIKSVLEGGNTNVNGPACPKCGKQIENDWVFCKHCGYKLK